MFSVLKEENEAMGLSPHFTYISHLLPARKTGIADCNPGHSSRDIPFTTALPEIS